MDVRADNDVRQPLRVHISVQEPAEAAPADEGVDDYYFVGSQNSVGERVLAEAIVLDNFIRLLRQPLDGEAAIGNCRGPRPLVGHCLQFSRAAV